jgi:hypothetical protein
MTEDRGQTTEDRGQTTGDRRQRADDRRRIVDFGLRKSAGQLVESSNGQMVQMVNCQVPDYLTNFLFD